MAPSKTPSAYASTDYPAPRPHALDQGYLEERFKALEARLAVLERGLTGENKPLCTGRGGGRGTGERTENT